MNAKNHGSQRISFKNVFIQIDKISDERARAGMEANVGTTESDGTFIIPGPGKRAVLRKIISFSPNKSRPSKRASPRTRSPRSQQEEDLYEVNSDNDSLDELLELEDR